MNSCNGTYTAPLKIFLYIYIYAKRGLIALLIAYTWKCDYECHSDKTKKFYLLVPKHYSLVLV